MHPPKFDYYRADSVSNAISLMQQHPDAKLLAGGHSLIPILNLRLDDPGALIDIGRVSDLKGVTVQRDGGCSIGSLTTHAEVAANSNVPTVLSEAAGIIGDPQVRNRGTVGGNVAHADPASDLPTVFTALEAEFEIEGVSGVRSVAAADFFKDMFVTDLKAGEILREIRARSLHPGRMFNDSAGSAYTKMQNIASRYAIVGAAAVIALENGKCTHASIAVGGLTPKATKAPSVEQALLGKVLDADTIAAAADAVKSDLGSNIVGDIHCSASYRREMIGVYVKRAVTKAVERAS